MHAKYTTMGELDRLSFDDVDIGCLTLDIMTEAENRPEESSK